MKKQKDEREKRRSLVDSSRTAAGGLLKTGVFSLLLHIALIVFLILTLKAGITKDGSSIYRVTIQPFSSQNNSNPGPVAGLSNHLPNLSRIQIQEEEHKAVEDIRQSEPIEEPKILPQHHEEEETVKKPIPLPMAEGSNLDADSNLKEEDNLPIALIPPHLGEQYRTSISDTGSGEGTGGSEWGGFGMGPGGGGSGWKGFQKGANYGHGGYGWGGSGNRSGTGQGGSGWGNPGNGGAGGLHPRYAENPKPVYPLEAREKGYQGEVLLRVEILPNGRVGQVEVKKSSGYEVLDQSALVAVKKWKFIPARKGEVAIPFWVNIPIKFQLL
jgi:TonB family protein